jgi:hypothetical protein
LDGCHGPVNARGVPAWRELKGRAIPVAQYIGVCRIVIN